MRLFHLSASIAMAAMASVGPAVASFKQAGGQVLEALALPRAERRTRIAADRTPRYRSRNERHRRVTRSCRVKAGRRVRRRHRRQRKAA